MNDYGFKSSWADLLAEYIDSKKKSGFKGTSIINNLRYFDSFCYSHFSEVGYFPKEVSDEFRIRPEGIKQHTHYKRVNSAKLFLQWLNLKGYNVYPPRDVSRNFEQFRPHIYTLDEINRYFKAVDTYPYGKARKMAITMPVLFRILYCCGTRIGEVLGIRKQDVDLESGVIKLIATKNGRERYTVVPDELRLLLVKYAKMMFWSIEDVSPIFPGLKNSTSISNGTIQSYHEEFLHMAGIPFFGGGRGPRIHDFRHTAIVLCCKQLVDSGMDMYSTMPYLATWAGHTTQEATEYYLRLTVEVFPYLQEKLKVTWEKVFDQLEVPE